MMGFRRLLLSYSLLLLSCDFVARVMAREPLETIAFRGSNIFPESFDWDVKHNRFLLGSTSSGSLLSVSLNGTVEEFVKDDVYASKASIFGVRVDRKHNRVVAAVQDFSAGNNHSVPNFSGLAAYDLDSKKRIFFTRLDGVGVTEGDNTFCNDVAIDPSGTAYVTNSAGNFVWKVTKDGLPSVFAQHVNFTNQPTIVDEAFSKFGLNGIVYSRLGFLLVVQTNSGALFRIDLDDAGVHLVFMRERLPGADGMVLREDGTLVVVSLEKVWLVGSASGWMAANVVDTVPLNISDSVTAAAMRKGSRTFILPSYLLDRMGGKSRKKFEVREIEFPAEFNEEEDPIWLILVIVLVVVVVCGWRFQMAHFYKEYRRKRA